VAAGDGYNELRIEDKKGEEQILPARPVRTGMENIETTRRSALATNGMTV